MRKVFRARERANRRIKRVAYRHLTRRLLKESLDKLNRPNEGFLRKAFLGAPISAQATSP